MYLILYHNKCPDGLYSAYLFNKVFRSSTTLGCNPNELPDVEILKAYDNIIMTDLYLTNEKIQSVLDMKKQVIYVDHHPRNDENDLKKLTGDFKYQWTDKHCASMIVYNTYFYKNNALLNYINKVDMGKFNELNSLEDYAFYAWYEDCSKEKNFISSIPGLEEAFNTNNSYFMYLFRRGEEMRKEIYEVYKNTLNDAKITTVKFNDDEYKVLYVEYDGPRGDLARYYCSNTQEWDIDILFAYGYDNTKTKYVASVRTHKDKDIDLNDFLNPFGGGGHKLAGGIVFDPTDLSKILNL